MQQTWQAVNLISPKTKVDCGPISVEFFNSDAKKSPTSTVLFKDDRKTAPVNFFRTLYNEDPMTSGSYPLLYRVYFTNYPMNEAESTLPFTISIVKYCGNPKSITPPSLESQ